MKGGGKKSGEKFDPTSSLLITTAPFHESVSDAGQKDTETTHLADFRECNISIMNVSAQLHREVEKTPLIDVTPYEKKY